MNGAMECASTDTESGSRDGIGLRYDTTMSTHDVIVIGAGQAGPGIAANYAGEGRRVALVEMERAGGTCLNHGCRPTKALRASGMVAHAARRASEYGVHVGDVIGGDAIAAQIDAEQPVAVDQVAADGIAEADLVPNHDPLARVATDTVAWSHAGGGRRWESTSRRWYSRTPRP